MMIEVCGPGCPRCQATENNVRKALQELGLKEGQDAMVMEIKDVRMISARGVIMTPAILIDGVKVSEGKIPDAREIQKWIKENLSKR